MNYIAIVHTPEGEVQEIEIFACQRPTNSVMSLLCRTTFGAKASLRGIFSQQEYANLAF